MAGLTRTEDRVFWRTLDEPHAAEDMDTPIVAPLNGSFPRGSAGLYCCGVNWGDHYEAGIHRSSVHH